MYIPKGEDQGTGNLTNQVCNLIIVAIVNSNLYFKILNSIAGSIVS